MKKIILSLTSAAVSVSLPLIALAEFSEEEAPNISATDLLDNVTNWLFSILLVTAAIFIIIAGFYFVTAAGDPDKTKKARDFVLYALIGVLVGFAARGLVYLVGTIAGQ